MHANLCILLNDEGKEMDSFSSLGNCFGNVVTIFLMTIFLSCQTTVAPATALGYDFVRVLVC